MVNRIDVDCSYRNHVKKRGRAMKSNDCLRMLLGLGSALLMNSSLVHAQSEYPNKPIRIVIGTPVGGGSELMARYIGQHLTPLWGQPIVVDARPGASGNIAADFVLKSPPDGYTLYVCYGTHTVNPSLFAKPPFDPVKDFTPITLIAKQYNALVVHPSVPVRTIKEFVALARNQPRKMNYGSAGNGSAGHLGIELLKQTAKIDLVHLPYKGAAPARTDLLGGHIETMFDVLRAQIPYKDAGRIRMLAVAAEQRQVIAPDIQTLNENGYKGMEVVTWHALLGPVGLSTAIVNRLQSEIRRGLIVAAFKEKVAQDGVDIIASSASELEVFLRADVEKWRKVIKTANIRID